MPIHLLSPTTINRIAAGEVIERPASVVKELVENSIDAGADKIEIVIENGGRNLVAVIDNGSGMDKKDLSLCLERHATSKLSDDDMFNIMHLGFRGEALPSIASVSRMVITTRQKGTDNAWSIGIEGGQKSETSPSSLQEGTTIEVRDLFCFTPTRLKFLKTERTETLYIEDIVGRLAMAYPNVEFTLKNGNKNILRTSKEQGDFFSTSLKRLDSIIGKDFAKNVLKIDVNREGASLRGYIGLPTYNRGNSTSQYLFVNGRPVKDKLLFGAIRSAYQDFIARDRYPVVVLYIELDANFVDVNVHPTKAEVRFHDTNMVRGMVVGAIKNALSSAGHLASTTTAGEAIDSFISSVSNLRSFTRPSYSNIKDNFGIYIPPNDEITNSSSNLAEKKVPTYQLPSFVSNQNPSTKQEELFSPDSTKSLRTSDYKEIKEQTEYVPYPNDYPLGIARCQLHETYIVSQTEDGIILVDQHAAHERLVYERMKRAVAGKTVKSQILLIPEVVELDKNSVEIITNRIEELSELGLVLEQFGENGIIVRETPALLGEVDIEGLIKQLAEDLSEFEDGIGLREKLQAVCATMACHGSVRAGRPLNQHEMNAILREMEETPYSGQCNHGRPTYVELKLKDIEELFGRR